MRIIEWNCQGAFRLKNKEIFDLKPDILIVLECEQEEKLQFGQLTPVPNDFLWYGDTGKKGIGVFSYSNFKLKLLPEFNPNFRYIVPFEVSDGTNSFLLFGIWAMGHKQNPLASYIAQVWLAVNYYQSILTYNSILVGDFNSNQIWDKKERVGNHTDVVNFLRKFQIESLYHKQFEEVHGEETAKTFFMHRNVEKSYHIDYIFASENIIKNGYHLTVENSQRWIDKSDHIPLILDLHSFKSEINIQHNHEDFAWRHLNNLTDYTKIKFKEEYLEIMNFARKLDSNKVNKECSKILISNIEAFKKIDKLTSQLQKNNYQNQI